MDFSKAIFYLLDLQLSPLYFFVQIFYILRKLKFKGILGNEIIFVLLEEVLLEKLVFDIPFTH